jgi:hypothetical protein
MTTEDIFLVENLGHFLVQSIKLRSSLDICRFGTYFCRKNMYLTFQKHYLFHGTMLSKTEFLTFRSQSKFCSQNDIEDEPHFLIKCAFYIY